MYEISNALSTKEIILDSDSLVVQNEYLDPRTEISKNVLSDFGTQFFKRYIIGRINWSLSKIVSPYFFENTQNQFNSRVLNVYDNQQLVGELISYSNASSKFQRFVAKWLGEFGLGSGIHVNVLENSISINIKNDEGEFNLLDEGFGTSRIVPLLLKIFSTAASIHTWEDNIMDSITMVIEEPELGLHPKLQSLLADMFIDAYRQFNMQFIIETHSEYMIRRLQVLTAKKEITPEDTQLYYFHHPRNIPEGEEQCYPINISEDGALSKNFGPGFFDESSNLNVALYRFSKENKN
jgi:predicted ATPase